MTLFTFAPFGTQTDSYRQYREFLLNEEFNTPKSIDAVKAEKEMKARRVFRPQTRNRPADRARVAVPP